MTGRPESPDLTNPRSERVRAVRALSGRSSRERRARFVVEGPQGVREVLRWAPADVLELFLDPLAATRHPELEAAARTGGVRLRTASTEVMAAMSVDAQGVLAVVRSSPTTLADAIGGAPRLVAVLASVRDPGNAGTVIRVADAAGADAVVLTSASVDVHNPKVVRASAGSLFHLGVATAVDLRGAVDSLRAAGLTVLAADAAGEHDLDDLQDGAATGPDLRAPTAWLFGNEAWGLPAADRALADAVVRVPIHGRAESLNLAAAAAVCLYASARAHRARR